MFAPECHFSARIRRTHGQVTLYTARPPCRLFELLRAAEGNASGDFAVDARKRSESRYQPRCLFAAHAICDATFLQDHRWLDINEMHQHDAVLAVLAQTASRGLPHTYI